MTKPFDVLTALGAPLALVAISAGLLAAFLERRLGRPVRSVTTIGGVAWFALAALSVKLSLTTVDWEHLWWSARYPLLGLLAGAGAVLGGFWSRSPRGRALVAAAVLGTVAVVGAAPLWTMERYDDPDPPSRATGAPTAALVEVFAFGFGGPVPSTMGPTEPPQVRRGLGSPPREVTVPMGSTGLAAVVVAVLGGVLLAARRAGARRRAWIATAPLAVLLFGPLLPGNWLWVERGLWENSPWLVRTYAWWVVSAVVATVALAVSSARAPRAPEADAEPPA